MKVGKNVDTIKLALILKFDSFTASPTPYNIWTYLLADLLFGTITAIVLLWNLVYDVRNWWVLVFTSEVDWKYSLVYKRKLRL